MRYAVFTYDELSVRLVVFVKGAKDPLQFLDFWRHLEFGDYIEGRENKDIIKRLVH